jgi:uncharacterized protein
MLKMYSYVQKKVKFEWDKYNTVKNWAKHEVRPYEAEETVTDEFARILNDEVHSDSELRYIIIGKTRKHRILYIVFVIRNQRIRVISARDANKKEVIIYEKKVNST